MIPVALGGMISVTEPVAVQADEDGSSIIQVQYRQPARHTHNNSSRSTVQQRQTQPAAKPKTQPVVPQVVAPDPLELKLESVLGPELARLRKTVKSTLDTNAKRPVSLQSSKPGDVLAFCFPYGTETLVYVPNQQPAARGVNAGSNGNYIYAIGALCWNYSCANRTLLRAETTGPVAKLGSGFQSKPSEFLGMLAMSKVSEEYEIKVSLSSYRLSDLIESEKLDCSSGSIQSWKLFGLAFYLPEGSTWKSYDGETWSIARMADEELRRKPNQGDSDVTDHLMALSAVVQHYEERGIEFDDTIREAKKYLETCRNFALDARNEQSLWHSRFFLYRGVGGDAYDTMFSSGNILRWIIYSSDVEQLNDPRIAKSVSALAAQIAKVPANASVANMTENQIKSLTVALHALSLYNQRVFAPIEEFAKSELEAEEAQAAEEAKATEAEVDETESDE